MSNNPLQAFTKYLKNPAELLNDLAKPLAANSSFEEQWINDAVSSISLRKIYIPHGKLLYLYQKIVGVILYGYEQKEIDSNVIVRLLVHLIEKGKAKDKALFSLNSYDTTLPSIFVSGISGVGKTKTIKTVLSNIPQVIEHYDPVTEGITHKQVVWLSFNCSPSMSMKGFVLNFFKAIDDILNTGYYKEWSVKSRGTSVDQHTIEMQKVTLIHSIGLIHVDELQFLINKSSIKDSASISKVEATFNEVKVPMLLSCTAQGVAWLKNNESLVQHQEITLVRRLCSDAHIEFHPIDYDSQFFNQFIENFFENNTSDKCTKAPEGFKTLFIKLTAGLIAAMTRLASLYIEMIKLRGVINFYDNGELLRVFHNNFKLYEPALEALRNKRFVDFESEYLAAQKRSGDTGKESHQVESPEVVIKNVQLSAPIKHLQKLNTLTKDIGVSFDDI
ncbi:AAA family ATPase [Colwellia sp. MB02u-10]|jgi:hypothetical protein|uniref:AAA family ATPase n=1 Tax=Colwellia sp. MB02u-10 TaxID=2759828 RepID=UPI0015F41B46|nr:AAA family ATPase [Colwellia sp. MB02u-10]MBA6339608.1 AAA family ATPase [Colwellia sp. MB02u-10]